MSTGLDITVPRTWSWSPLRYITTFLNRGTAPDYVDDGPVRAISQAANQLSGLDWRKTRFHNYHGDPRQLKGYLLPHDVLINSTGNGTLGRVGYFTNGPNSIPCVADGHVTVARAYRTITEPRYLYYWLSSIPFQDYIYSALVVGATNQIELSRERLAGSPTLVPPLDEQRRIADFLDAETARIDQLLETRARQRSTIDELGKSWRNNLFRESKSGTWTRLKHLLRAKPRYGVLVPEFVDDGVPFIRINNLSGLSTTDGLAKIPGELSAQYSRTLTTLGDVLLSVVGTLGRTAIVTEELVGANTARAVAVLRFNHRYSPVLFEAWTGSSGFEEQAILATGSDSAQPTLGMEDLANFAIRWPADDIEQAAMATTVEDYEQELSATRATLNRQTALLAERRQALITAAVTGQIGV